MTGPLNRYTLIVVTVQVEIGVVYISVRYYPSRLFFFVSPRFLTSMKKKVYKVYLGWDKQVLDRTFASEADAINYANELAVDTLVVSTVL